MTLQISLNMKETSFDFYNDKCVAYVMDKDQSIDIDTLQDFVIAETVMKMKKGDTNEI